MVKINSLSKSLNFDGKFLNSKSKKYTGIINKDLNSGKKLKCEYGKGLLKTAYLFDGENLRFKKYTYDANDNLINVKNKFKDIFTKEIKHNIGIKYTRDEIINDIIGKTYDESNKLIMYAIPQKLLYGFIKYFDNLSVETRYFLNQAKYLGDGRIQLKYNEGDPILNNGIVDKTIIRMNNGSRSVFLSNGKNLKGKFVDSKGKQGAELNFLVDNNSNPIWVRAEDSKNKWSYDKKLLYDDKGNKYREIYSEGNRQTFVENTFDKNANIILSRKLNSKGRQIQRIEFKYNDKNLLTNSKTFDRNNKLVESIKNLYDKNDILRKKITTYYDKFGSSKSIYEYDKKGILFKLTELYDDVSMESFYDSDEKLIRYVEKDSKKKIKFIHEYFYDDIDKIKTVVKNSNNKERYHIEHIHSIKNGIMKDINEYKSPKNKLLGKEYIIHNEEKETTKCIYTNNFGKRINKETLGQIVGNDI